jgi:hypothetical protein
MISLTSIMHVLTPALAIPGHPKHLFDAVAEC